MKKFILAGLAVAVLSGCAGTPHRNEMIGTTVGAGIGAALGSMVGGGYGRVAAMAIGAVVGGAAGNIKGREQDVLQGTDGQPIGYPSQGYPVYGDPGTDAAYARGRADYLRAQQRRAEAEAYQRGRMGQ